MSFWAGFSDTNNVARREANRRNHFTSCIYDKFVHCHPTVWLFCDTELGPWIPICCEASRRSSNVKGMKKVFIL
ncbi:unnamed protein product [Calypogeia fissa]